MRETTPKSANFFGHFWMELVIRKLVSDVNRILNGIKQGNPLAAEELLPLVKNDEPPRIAASRMAKGLPGQTLQPTALVHEAWLRLAGGPGFDDRAHFFAAAGEAMRRILIESARRKNSQKRGAGSATEELQEFHLVEAPPHETGWDVARNGGDFH